MKKDSKFKVILSKNFLIGSIVSVALLVILGVFLPIKIGESVNENLTLGSFFEYQEAQAAVRVKGYYRKDGTYVRPHYRSNPDGNPYNNWSFPGNTNPYTGKTATGNPDTYLKNHYNSSGSSSYTPRYSVPAAPPIPVCPSNAYYSSTRKSCLCIYGYARHPNGKSCVKVPENAYAIENETDAWLCNFGYEEIGNTCVKIEEEEEGELALPITNDNDTGSLDNVNLNEPAITFDLKEAAEEKEFEEPKEIPRTTTYRSSATIADSKDDDTFATILVWLVIIGSIIYFKKKKTKEGSKDITKEKKSNKSDASKRVEKKKTDNDLKDLDVEDWKYAVMPPDNSYETDDEIRELMSDYDRDYDEAEEIRDLADELDIDVDEANEIYDDL